MSNECFKLFCLYSINRAKFHLLRPEKQNMGFQTKNKSELKNLFF